MKNIRRILSLFMGTILGIFLIMSACKKEDKNSNHPPPDSISFSTHVIPIFNYGCNTYICHGAGGTAPNLIEGNAFNSLINGGYVDIDMPEASIIYTTMTTGGSMSPYVNNPGDPDIILLWIEQGALDN